MSLIAKFENAATGALLMMAFDIVVTFLAQFLFFQVIIIQYIFYSC